MAELFTPDNIAALLTLTALEVVLGIDNVVFISILAGKLEKAHQARARTIGLVLAMVARIVLLFAISWIMGLTAELFTLPFFDGPITSGGGGEHNTGHSNVLFDPVITGRDLILILGGAFLVFKATHEMHDKLEGSKETIHQPQVSKFGSVLMQIVLMDLVFSLDSVITAVGMVGSGPEGTPPWVPITIMVTAIVISMVIMLIFAGPIARFIEKHPTTKMLALAFLFMIGLVLVVEGFGVHVPKGYVYSAMVFSLIVEVLNLRLRKARKPGQEPAST